MLIDSKNDTTNRKEKSQSINIIKITKEHEQIATKTIKFTITQTKY